MHEPQLILVVDDNTAFRAIMKDMLADSNARFVECTDGSAALALYKQHHPTWVLIDIRMQPMDGITATRKIKEAFPEARIIIVTNYHDSQLRDDALHAGAAAFVMKDDLSPLLTMITEYT